MIESIIITVIISLFCLGLRTITDEGKVFYFLRKPFEWHENRFLWMYYKTLLRFRETGIGAENLDALAETERRTERASEIVGFIMKPIILCVACFASFWGAIIYGSMTFAGLITEPSVVQWIICSISSSFINAYCWAKWERI